MALTFKDVAEILKIIDASQCEELVLDIEGTHLVVRRGGPSRTASVAETANRPQAAAPTANRAVPDNPGPASAAAAEFPEGVEVVRSPMVGTFYRAPEPGKPPFVEVGTTVGKGGPLCLIEVMKLFTTIEAAVDGTIDSVLVEDGAQVEFDQPLFTIRPG